MCDITQVLKNNPDVCLKRNVGEYLTKILQWKDEWFVIRKWRQAEPRRVHFGDDLDEALKKFLE